MINIVYIEDWVWFWIYKRIVYTGNKDTKGYVAVKTYYI